MATFAICYPDGRIQSVRRSDEAPEECGVNADLPEGGFYIDLTGQKAFDELDIMDILTGYKANAKTKKLVKLKSSDAK